MFNWYWEFISGFSFGFEFIPIEIVDTKVVGHMCIVDLLIFRLVFEYLEKEE
jgi:hypothetical protein